MYISERRWQEAYRSLLIRFRHVPKELAEMIIGPVVDGWKAEHFPETAIMSWNGYADDVKEPIIIKIRQLVNKALEASEFTEVVVWVKNPTHYQLNDYLQ